MQSATNQLAREEPQTDGADWLTLLAYTLGVLFIAANFVAVRFSNRELPPFWGAGLRFMAASLLFLLFTLIQRTTFLSRRSLSVALIYGVLQFGAGYAFIYWSMIEVPAGLASVILACIPLFTLFFAHFAGQESIKLRGILGSLTALGGIAILFGERAGQTIPPQYFLAAVAAALCFALAPVVVKSFTPASMAATNGVAMLAGGILLVALSFFTGEPRRMPAELSAWLAVVYLILPGSVGVFAILLFVLRRWTASAASYQTVLAPFAAIGLSAWLLDESLTGGLLLGGTLVLAGVYLGALRSQD